MYYIRQAFEKLWESKS